MKNVYYFHLQNIVDLNECNEKTNDNVLKLFKDILKNHVKENKYEISVIDNEIELFKIKGGYDDGRYPYDIFEKNMKVLFQKSITKNVPLNVQDYPELTANDTSSDGITNKINDKIIIVKLSIFHKANNITNSFVNKLRYGRKIRDNEKK
uniref:Uncharacterized protein n=1 Tax=viral metagenome TaxID=1070528 RepID=A0A6C0HBI5_9ZZZZ